MAFPHHPSLHRSQSCQRHPPRRSTFDASVSYARRVLRAPSPACVVLAAAAHHHWCRVLEPNACHELSYIRRHARCARAYAVCIPNTRHTAGGVSIHPDSSSPAPRPDFGFRHYRSPVLVNTTPRHAALPVAVSPSRTSAPLPSPRHTLFSHRQPRLHRPLVASKPRTTRTDAQPCISDADHQPAQDLRQPFVFQGTLMQRTASHPTRPLSPRTRARTGLHCMQDLDYAHLDLSFYTFILLSPSLFFLAR